MSRDFEDGASKLTTTHLEMAEPFARVLGPFRISVDGFEDTRVGPRPRMALRAKPPEGLFQQYSRELRWLAEEGGFDEVRRIVEEGVKALKNAAGEGRGELELSLIHI